MWNEKKYIEQQYQQIIYLYFYHVPSTTLKKLKII